MSGGNDYLANLDQMTNAQLARIFASVDAADGSVDGKLEKTDESLFAKAMASTFGGDASNYTALVQDYLDALEAAGGVKGSDGAYTFGDETSVSAADRASGYSSSDENYANSEGYTNTSTRSDATSNRTFGYATNSESLTAPSAPTYNSVAGTLEGKSAADLRSARDSLTGEIDAKRAEIETKKSEYQQSIEEAKTKYDSLLEESDKNDEELETLKQQKTDKEAEITTQEGIVGEIKSAISSQQSTVESLQGSVDSNAGLEPQEGNFTKEITNEDGTKETVPDTDAYQTAYNNWKAEQTRLENDLKQAQDELSSMEQQLAEAEDALNVLEQEATEIDNLIGAHLEEQNESGEPTELQQALEAYQNAQAEQDNAISALEADLAAMEADLSEYDSAIATAESLAAQLQANENLGEGEVIENRDFGLNAEEQDGDGGAIIDDGVRLKGEDLETALTNAGIDLSGYENKGSYYTNGQGDCIAVVTNEDGVAQVLHSNAEAKTTTVYNVNEDVVIPEPKTEKSDTPDFTPNNSGALDSDQVATLTTGLQDGSISWSDVPFDKYSADTLLDIGSQYGDSFAADLVENGSVSNVSNAVYKLANSENANDKDSDTYELINGIATSAFEACKGDDASSEDKLKLSTVLTQMGKLDQGTYKDIVDANIENINFENLTNSAVQNLVRNYGGNDLAGMLSENFDASELQDIKGKIKSAYDAYCEDLSHQGRSSTMSSDKTYIEMNAALDGLQSSITVDLLSAYGIAFNESTGTYSISNSVDADELGKALAGGGASRDFDWNDVPLGQFDAQTMAYIMVGYNNEAAGNTNIPSFAERVTTEITGPTQQREVFTSMLNAQYAENSGDVVTQMLKNALNNDGFKTGDRETNTALVSGLLYANDADAEAVLKLIGGVDSKTGRLSSTIVNKVQEELSGRAADAFFKKTVGMDSTTYNVYNDLLTNIYNGWSSNHYANIKKLDMSDLYSYGLSEKQATDLIAKVQEQFPTYVPQSWQAYKDSVASGVQKYVDELYNAATANLGVQNVADKVQELMQNTSLSDDQLVKILQSYTAENGYNITNNFDALYDGSFVTNMLDLYDSKPESVTALLRTNWLMGHSVDWSSATPEQMSAAIKVYDADDFRFTYSAISPTTFGDTSVYVGKNGYHYTSDGSIIPQTSASPENKNSYVYINNTWYNTDGTKATTTIIGNKEYVCENSGNIYYDPQAGVWKNTATGNVVK